MARCDEAGSELFCARFLSVLDSSLNPKNPARPDSLNHIILKALKEAPPLAATKGLAILKKNAGFLRKHVSGKTLCARPRPRAQSLSSKSKQAIEESCFAVRWESC